MIGSAQSLTDDRSFLRILTIVKIVRIVIDEEKLNSIHLSTQDRIDRCANGFTIRNELAVADKSCTWC